MNEKKKEEILGTSEVGKKKGKKKKEDIFGKKF